MNKNKFEKGALKMFCGYCGKQADDGVKFCPYCGKPMQGESVVVIETEENITMSGTIKNDKSEEASSAFIDFLKSLKKAKKLIIAAIVVLVVIIAGVGIVKSQNSVLGTWEYSYCEYKGQRTEEIRRALYIYGAVQELTLYSDGTFIEEPPDDYGYDSSTGTYNLINDGEKIVFYYDRYYYTMSNSYEFDRKGNELIFITSDDRIIHYKKTK